MTKRKRDASMVPEIPDDSSLEEVVSDGELSSAIEDHDTSFRDPDLEVVEVEEAVPTPVSSVPEMKPKVPLRVFIASSGIRWDQMAGFRSFAKRHKMGPLTIPEWREEFAAFMKRPV